MPDASCCSIYTPGTSTKGYATFWPDFHGWTISAGRSEWIAVGIALPRVGRCGVDHVWVWLLDGWCRRHEVNGRWGAGQSEPGQEPERAYAGGDVAAGVKTGQKSAQDLREQVVTDGCGRAARDGVAGSHRALRGRLAKRALNRRLRVVRCRPVEAGRSVEPRCEPEGAAGERRSRELAFGVREGTRSAVDSAGETGRPVGPEPVRLDLPCAW